MSDLLYVMEEYRKAKNAEERLRSTLQNTEQLLRESEAREKKWVDAFFSLALGCEFRIPATDEFCIHEPRTKAEVRISGSILRDARAVNQSRVEFWTSWINKFGRDVK